MFNGQCKQPITVLCDQGLVGSNNMLAGTNRCLDQFPGDSGAADQLNKYRHLRVRRDREDITTDPHVRQYHRLGCPAAHPRARRPDDTPALALQKICIFMQ